MPTPIIVAGHGNSGPEHWQSWLQAQRPDCVRVRQRNWEWAIRSHWVAGLEHTLRRVKGPKVLVAHSLGCATAVEWAGRSHALDDVVGAILVAPPDTEQHLPGFPPRWAVRLAGWAPIRQRALPFRSIVVASSNDPFCRLDRARHFAQIWGSSLINLGQAGHINTAAGYGPWPLLLDLLAQFPA
jgi:predicted alpha/beta hydrolase family esterase